MDAVTFKQAVITRVRVSGSDGPHPSTTIADDEGGDPDALGRAASFVFERVGTINAMTFFGGGMSQSSVFVNQGKGPSDLTRELVHFVEDHDGGGVLLPTDPVIGRAHTDLKN